MYLRDPFTHRDVVDWYKTYEQGEVARSVYLFRLKTWGITEYDAKLIVGNDTLGKSLAWGFGVLSFCAIIGWLIAITGQV